MKPQRRWLRANYPLLSLHTEKDYYIRMAQVFEDDYVIAQQFEIIAVYRA
jgi:hypothetical protein